MANAGFRNVQDHLNRMNPTAAEAALGDWLYALTNQFNTLQAKYNALLAHLDTANVAGIGNTNVATYGATTTAVPLPDDGP